MVWIDRERMPAESESSHRLDGVDHNPKRLPRMRFLKLRHFGIDDRRYNPAGHLGTGDERTIKLNTEPRAETGRIADRLPDTFSRRIQDDVFVDLICIQISLRVGIRQPGPDFTRTFDVAIKKSQR